jgi:hypothetical protein
MVHELQMLYNNRSIAVVSRQAASTSMATANHTKRARIGLLDNRKGHIDTPGGSSTWVTKIDLVCAERPKAARL